MYKLIISFIWSSPQAKMLVCGKGILSGNFYGWKAKMRFNWGMKNQGISKGEIKKEEGKVIWILEDESLDKLKLEELDFTKPLSLLKGQNALLSYERLGVLITFDYFKDGVKI